MKSHLPRSIWMTKVKGRIANDQVNMQGRVANDQINARDGPEWVQSAKKQ